MLKAAGMLFLLLACTAAGFSKAHTLERRVVRLREIYACMEELGQRIRCDGSERDRLLQAVFGGRGILAAEGNGIRLLDCGITAEDGAVLQEFFAKLGSGDSEAESDRVRLTLALLKKQREEAEHNAAALSRLYRTVGLCAGLFGCILFL